MPSLIDYPTVQNTLQGRGLRCLYHHSGAFGFAAGSKTDVVGWIGPEDTSIKPAMRDHLVTVPPPHAQTLSRLAERAWEQFFADEPAWVMPVSHWAHELDPAHGAWLGALLTEIGVHPLELAGRNEATAIEFIPSESPSLAKLLEGLLSHLRLSDFALAFPRQALRVLIHHHQQIWWMSRDVSLIQQLKTLAVEG